MDLETVITGLRRALVEGERRLGISSHLIMCFLRHLSSEAVAEISFEASFLDEGAKNMLLEELGTYLGL